jgi:short-subunit dehydrogenase
MRSVLIPCSVLITGASSGLGAALARQYARPGSHLHLIARNRQRLTRVAEDCRLAGASVVVSVIDVRATDMLVRLIEAADRAHPIDVVFANAGIEASALGGEERISDIIAQLRINLEAAIATVVPLIPSMCARRSGTIVLVSSLAALMPLPDQPAYCASKAGLLAWGKALAPVLRSRGVNVTIVCPGFIDTDMALYYAGWRPLQWSAARASARIAKAVAKRVAFTAFPWPLVLIIHIGRLMPWWLQAYILEKMFHLSVASGGQSGTADGFKIGEPRLDQPALDDTGKEP